jgi:S1-C subfamily serine protease/HEAT repeat protein
MTTAEIVARSEPSVALVKGKQGLGTGFLVKPGILVTSAHVIAHERIHDIEIRFPSADEARKGPFSAELLDQDRVRDLAILEVKSDLPPLEVADSYEFKKGEDITVIGNPGVGSDLVLENAVSRGVASSQVVIDGQSFLQLGVSINPGNSGGPVFDARGRVIGVASLRTTRQEALAFCIPAEDLRAALARAEQRVEQIAAGKPATRSSAVELHYGWKPGETYVYAVQIMIDAGKVVTTLSGSSIYKAKSADANAIMLAHRGWLTTRRRTKDGSPPPNGAVNAPQSPSEVELTISPKGDVVNSTGSSPVPLLGDLALLVIEPFPDAQEASWDEVKTLALQDVETSISNGGPLRLARPSLRELHDARVGGHLPGRSILPGRSRLQSPSRLRGRQLPAPIPPPSTTVKVTNHPAEESSEYSLGRVEGELVSIAKTYQLKTEEMVDGEPALQMIGDGTLTFDFKQGIPVEYRFQAKIVATAENATVRIPITVTCKRLEGDERAKALVFPVMPPTEMNPITGEEVDRLIVDLRSSDSGRRSRACDRLRQAAPIDAKRDTVVQAAGPLLEVRDVFLRSAAIQVLGVWGNRQAADRLIDQLDGDRKDNRGELFDALGRFEPDERTINTMIVWLAKDAGAASRVLRAMGPAAEDALIKVVEADGDFRVRNEACRVLGAIGTCKSLTPLEALVRRRDNAALGREAERAVNEITARYLSDAEVTLAIEELGNSNIDRRRAAVHRLELAHPVEARRAEVSSRLLPLANDSDRDLQLTALRALGAWGDEQSAQALAKLLYNKSFGPWREVVEALGRCSKDEQVAEAIASRVDEDSGLVGRALQSMGSSAEKTAIKILETNPKSDARQEAARILKVVGTKDGLPALQAAAENRKDAFLALGAQDALRVLAARTISESEVTVAIQSLSSPDDTRRLEGLDRLIDVAPIAARRGEVSTAIASILADPKDDVQTRAYRALALWGDERNSSALSDRIKDKSNRYWREAAQLLANLAPGEPTADALLGRFLDDPMLVAMLLREMKPMPEQSLIHAFQANPELRVRIEACKVLASAGTKLSLPILREAVAHINDGSVANNAQEALSAIARRE